MIRLIYCQAGNRRTMMLARSLGWFSGVRSDDTIYDEARPLTFLDCHWEGGDWARHRDVIERERPSLAVVPDVMRAHDLTQAIVRAEEIAPFIVHPVIVPKAHGIIGCIPPTIEGRRVVLGYSVPTRYGGTEVMVSEFGRRPVHLLGGSPSNQVGLAHYLNVVSADGNYAWRIARHGMFVDSHGKYVRIREADGVPWPSGQDMPYEALRRSLSNIPALWWRWGFVPELQLETA